MQSGGSLSARTENVPIDVAWGDVGKDMRSIPAANLPKTDSRLYEKFGGLNLQGLESDKAIMYDEIEGLKGKLEQGIGEGYSREQYDADVKRLRRLVTVGVSGLKQKETRFKEVMVSAAQAKGDLAIQGGMAFVQDTTNGSYKVVPVTELLQEKVDVEGKKVNRYKPQTVGTAMEQRASNPELHGFTGGQGEAVEGILSSIRSTANIQDQIKKAFATTGYSVDQQTGMKSFAGVPGNTLADYMDALVGGKNTEAMSKFTQKNKSNMNNLMNAKAALESTLASSGLLDGLQRQAYGEYIAQYGETDKAPEPEKWVGDRVESLINNHMLMYLRQETANGQTASGRSGSSGSSGSEGKYENNPGTFGLQLPDGGLKRFSAVNNKGDSGSNYTVSTYTSTIEDDKLFNESYRAGRRPAISNNSTVHDFASGSDLKKNLFIATNDNVPLDKLGKGKTGGLNRAMLDPDSSPVIMHSMLTYDNNGSKGVAWDIMSNPNFITMQKTVQQQFEKANQPASGDAYNAALLRLVQKNHGLFGGKQAVDGLQFRKVVGYDVLIPLDLKYWWGVERGEADSYRKIADNGSLVSDPYKVAEYRAAMESSKDADDAFGRGEDLYSVRAYSILNPDETINTVLSQHYKSNKITEGEFVGQASGVGRTTRQGEFN